MVQPYYVSWRKMVWLLWNFPHTTHCDFLLSTIKSSFPIDITLEKRCTKFLWASLNSENKVVKMVTLSSKVMSVYVTGGVFAMKS